MSRLRVQSFSISLDGYGAGPDQDLESPLGVGGSRLHEWAFGTRTFQKMFGGNGGSTGVDDDFAARGFENVGAWIMGRNMFGPIRGPWPDDRWKGWWGPNPPYHNQVFVLTHHARHSVTMEGGTTFHFVAEGIHAALERATEAAGGKDVRLGGGVATVREYVVAGLVDEMHLAISPVLLGSGEHLFAGIDAASLGLEVAEHVLAGQVAHVVLTRRGRRPGSIRRARSTPRPRDARGATPRLSAEGPKEGGRPRCHGAGMAPQAGRPAKRAVDPHVGVAQGTESRLLPEGWSWRRRGDHPRGLRNHKEAGMRKFLVLYRSTMSNREQMMKMPPEQRKPIMDAWASWATKSGPALIDVGAPLGDSTHIKGTAGPGFLGGYSMVQAESSEAAVRLFDGHPHFGAPGASIELLEVMSMPGM